MSHRDWIKPYCPGRSDGNPMIGKIDHEWQSDHLLILSWGRFSQMSVFVASLSIFMIIIVWRMLLMIRVICKPPNNSYHVRRPFYRSAGPSFICGGTHRDVSFISPSPWDDDCILISCRQYCSVGPVGDSFILLLYSYVDLIRNLVDRTLSDLENLWYRKNGQHRLLVTWKCIH